MDNETHKCTACSCEYTDDEGGIQGNFGMLPMSFCPTCYACIWDMVDQQKEWVGLTDEDIENCFDESCHLKVVDPKGGIKGSVNIFEVGRAIVQLCKERNT